MPNDAPIGGMSAPLEEGGRHMPKATKREWNEGSRPMWRAGHAPLNEIEPDMEHDPTLAACCVRELSENRKNRMTMDALRAAMPGTLVNKNWIVGPGDGGRHGHECGCCHDDTERAERNAELERWIQEKRDRGSSSGEEDSEDEIDRLLAEVDDDLEVLQIRDARMSQLKGHVATMQLRDASTVSEAQHGKLCEVPAQRLEMLVHTQLHVVALLCPTDGKERGHGGDEPTEVTLARHLSKYAPEFRGTSFVAVHIRGAEGQGLLKTVRTEKLPAVVCFREGVIVARACGAVRQFTQMGDIGEAVFRAWLWQTKTMRAALEDSRQKARQKDSDEEEEEEEGKAARPIKSFAKAVFTTSGDTSDTCTQPNCSHRFKHEHLASFYGEAGGNDDEEDID